MWMKHSRSSPRRKVERIMQALSVSISKALPWRETKSSIAKPPEKNFFSLSPSKKRKSGVKRGVKGREATEGLPLTPRETKLRWSNGGKGKTQRGKNFAKIQNSFWLICCLKPLGFLRIFALKCRVCKN